jgi:hypothetical protein
VQNNFTSNNMENHHHEEPKPTNKWMATPILLAVVIIGIIAGFLSMKSTACCDGECKDKNKTEEHATTHEENHGDVKTTETTADSTASTTDSTEVVEDHENHDAHGH